MTSIRALAFVALIAGWFMLMAAIMWIGWQINGLAGWIATAACLLLTARAVMSITPLPPEDRDEG